MSNGTLYRMSAFAAGNPGGNPAGVWLGAALPGPATMQRIASEVGYSETAFLAPLRDNEWVARYYSPEAEVSFCGHATIAAGVVLGQERGEDTYSLSTQAGEVSVAVVRQAGGMLASLRSVPPRHEAVSPRVVSDAIAAIRWSPADVDTSLPVAKAYAGAWHLVIAAASAERLAALDYDFDTLKQLMLRENLTTLQLVWRERHDLYHARNPFPVGGVVEDPATGAAAAALGGYLRDAGLVEVPYRFQIRQGEAMGRPSLLTVEVPVAGGILVSGSATAIPDHLLHEDTGRNERTRTA